MQESKYTPGQAGFVCPFLSLHLCTCMHALFGEKHRPEGLFLCSKASSAVSVKSQWEGKPKKTSQVATG